MRFRVMRRKRASVGIYLLCFTQEMEDIHVLAQQEK